MYRYTNINIIDCLLCCQQFAFFSSFFIQWFWAFFFRRAPSSPFSLEQNLKDEMRSALIKCFGVFLKGHKNTLALHEKSHLINGKKQLKYFHKILSQRRKLRRYQIDSHLFGTLAHLSRYSLLVLFSPLASFHLLYGVKCGSKLCKR